MQIAESVVVVTGGASGLGAATSQALSVAGAHVVIVDIEHERARELAVRIGGEALSADVTDVDAAESVASFARSLGAVRGLVNCAGGGGRSHRILRANGDQFDVAVFDRVVQLNLYGTFLMTRALAPAIAASPPLDADGSRGVIVNVSSVAGLVGPAGVAPYAASKAAIIGLTKTTARDLAPYGIRAMAIAPGPIDTPLFRTFAPADQAAMSAGCTFPKRAGDPREFAALVEHIFRNDFLNATCIRLDGGTAAE